MRAGGSIKLALAFLLVGGATSAAVHRDRLPRAPREVTIRALQATDDSMQVAVTWTNSTPVSLVRGYVFEVRAPAWTLVDTLSASILADTLWLPRDTTDVAVATCVRALTDGADSPESCTVPLFVIPHTVLVSAPGAPVVIPIGGTASILDSTAILVFGVEGPGPAPYVVIGWTDENLPSPIMVTCGQLPTGEVGWAEVVVDWTMPGLRVVQSGLFGAEPDCGWLLVGTEPPTIEFSDWPMTPYRLGSLTYKIDIAFTWSTTSGTYDVALQVTDYSTGDPVMGVVPVTEVLAGAWGDDTTAARPCQTTALGLCGVGDIKHGTSLRVSLAEAETVIASA